MNCRICDKPLSEWIIKLYHKMGDVMASIEANPRRKIPICVPCFNRKKRDENTATEGSGVR